MAARTASTPTGLASLGSAAPDLEAEAEAEAEPDAEPEAEPDFDEAAAPDVMLVMLAEPDEPDMDEPEALPVATAPAKNVVSVLW